MTVVERPAALRRIAAMVAILGLAGSLVAAVFVFVGGGGWRILVAIASIAVAVGGLWYAVTRRSAPRLVGTILAPVGLIVFLAVSLTADHRGLPLVAVFALVLASGAAARYALHRDPRTLRAAPVSGKPIPRPDHPVLLMNPKSGGGKAERFHLVDECRARGIEPIVLRLGDDLLELTEDAVGRGADVLGMAGGDGSQALVATVASKHDVPHVCVPAGTRNHFALDLGLDRENVVGALDAFHDGVERRVDLARVNGRVFVNNASMGLYAKIVQSQAYRDAKMKTAADMLPDMLGPDAEPFDLRFTGPDGSENPSAHLILVSNDPYQLDHLSGRGTRERMDLGTLGVVAARISSAADAVTFVGLEAAGKIRSFPGWLEWDSSRFQVDSNAPVEIGIDGEAMLMDPPLVFESLPSALRIRLPKHAPGFAPAAASVPLTTSTIGALFRTAAGRPLEPA
jgi:diacylglycerol kinase family enzyme